MTDAEPTWIAQIRDLSSSVEVAGEPVLMACLFLDADTGLVMGVHVATDAKAAAKEALRKAMRRPPAGAMPGPPGRILCPPPWVRVLEGAAKGVAALRGVPVQPADVGDGAQDIFDSFVGHLAGRPQATEPPEPDDWRTLIAQAGEFWRAEPWERWADDVDLHFEASVGDRLLGGVATVIGNVGYQRGLVVFPDQRAAEHFRQSDGAFFDVSPGTTVITFDPPADYPADVVTRAVRYGWPQDVADSVGCMAFEADGPMEISHVQSQLLTVALASVLALDRRGLVPAARLGAGLDGQVDLGPGPADFTVKVLPPPEGESGDAPGQDVGVLLVNLVPDGVPVVLASAGPDEADDLCSRARLLRRIPVGAPEVPSGASLPVVLIPAPGAAGEQVVSQLVALDPLWVVDHADDQDLAVIAVFGRNGVGLLMETEADSVALTSFRQQLVASDGRHLLVVASPADGEIAGLWEVADDQSVAAVFECFQPAIGGGRGPARSRRPASSGPVRPRAKGRGRKPGKR